MNTLKHHCGCRYVLLTMYTKDGDVVSTKLTITRCCFHSILERVLGKRRVGVQNPEYLPHSR